MFSGSDEFVLREIADKIGVLADLYNIQYRTSIELSFQNTLKLYELGKIDDSIFNKRYEWYINEINKVNQFIK